jgi:hypothetical protein
MSPLTESTRLTLAKSYVGIDDPDAAAYITAVEAADTAAGQSGGLETATKVAIHSFVKGCKADGIWPAIKASCILAGARTLAGALVPLVGTAPTNVGGNFVSGDYNRKTGLVGNGSSKYLNSNRPGAASSANNQHLSTYVTSPPTLSLSSLGGSDNTQVLVFSTNIEFRVSDAGSIAVSSPIASLNGLVACSRASVAGYSYRARAGVISGFYTTSTSVSNNNNFLIFARSNNSFPQLATDARLAFYSIGDSLDLALLDTRVSALITAFGVAIP